MRAAFAMVSLAALMAALSACGENAGPAATAADPTPAATPSAAAAQATAPTPAPPTPVSTPALSPLPAAFIPGDRSDRSQGPYEAPDFTLADGFGEKVVLADLLGEHEAVVLIFYRGFF